MVGEILPLNPQNYIFNIHNPNRGGPYNLIAMSKSVHNGIPRHVVAPVPFRAVPCRAECNVNAVCMPYQSKSIKNPKQQVLSTTKDKQTSVISLFSTKPDDIKSEQIVQAQIK